MSEAASYEVRLSAPPGIAPVTSGTLAVEAEEDDATTYRCVIEGARDFSVVFVDGYEQREEIVDGVAVRAWFTTPKQAAADVTLRRASDAVALYSDRIGPLRYREIDLVEVPLQVAAGVEFSGLILISSGYAERPFAAFFDIIVSHEMAHQWFYAGVGNDISEHPWLDESLATYLSYVFLDAFAEPGVASEALGQWERAYESARSNAPHRTIASPLYAFSQSSTYSGFVYSGGAIFLHAVRDAIGDQSFFAALASYYAAYLGRIASPSGLIKAFETACACRLTGLLDAYGVHP